MEAWRRSLNRPTVAAFVTPTIQPVSDSPNQALIEEVAASEGTVMLIGGADTGKTTLARDILEAAGTDAAYIDADVGTTTTGPPACVGMKLINGPEDLSTMSQADELRFVGSVRPERLILQIVVATTALVEAARRQARLVVVDTTSAVAGVVGETLKYHTVEMCRPDRLVALQRGSELEPIIGMLRRFFDMQIDSLPVRTDLIPTPPDERWEHLRAGMAKALEPPLDTWKVRATVFAPTLPTGLDLERLDSMLVGIHDGAGRCLGLGVLEHREDGLRVHTNVASQMQGLRLGSLKVDRDTYEVQAVNLRRTMFGLEDV